MDNIFDDLLLEGPSSQECCDDDSSDESEDEILFGDLDDEPTLWDIQDVLPLMPGAPADMPCSLVGNVEGVSVQSRPTDTSSSSVEPGLRDRLYVIARIEAILQKMLESLLEEDQPMIISLKSRSALSRRRTKAQEEGPIFPEPKERNISFPGASAQEAWNFTVLLRVIEIVHGGLVENKVMTKRDIYYRQPDLFLKQSVVDRYVDDLACTFGITRSQLNVTAAAKGLVAGNFTVVRASGHEVHAINETEGILVPIMANDDKLIFDLLRWILVIEKEATFRALLSSPQWETMKPYGVVLTAKGYPDIASRRFLRRTADHNSRIPMYAFVDLDPDGIAIMSTYKYGSYRLAHEDVTSNDIPGLSLPNIRWLGLKGHHISRTPVGESDTDTGVMPQLQGHMRLTGRDRAKAMRMLEWDLCAEDGPEQEWRQELQSMLMLNMKAEMQILDELPGGLCLWLRDELERACEQPMEYVGLEDCEHNTQNHATEDGMLF